MLVNKVAFDGSLMIDFTYLKVHRTAVILLKKGSFHVSLGQTKGGLNSKLHAVCDGHGRPVLLLLTEGHVSDYKGAAILQHLLPDNSSFRQTEVMTPCGCWTL